MRVDTHTTEQPVAPKRSPTRSPTQATGITDARVNGRVHIVEKDELDNLALEPERLNPDDNAHLVQGIMMKVDEAYLHCPRAFRFSELWNTDVIEQNKSRSLKSLV